MSESENYEESFGQVNDGQSIEGNATTVCDNQFDESRDDRNIFDRIGDFFYRMVKGILIFAIFKLPKIIWRFVTSIERLKFLLKYTRSVVRAIFWMVAWITIVFAAWMAFGWQAFVRFWTGVAEVLLDCLLAAWTIFMDHFGTIWMIIALIGSAYGLIHVSIKRRRERKVNAEKMNETSGDIR